MRSSLMPEHFQEKPGVKSSALECIQGCSMTRTHPHAALPQVYLGSMGEVGISERKEDF